MRNCAPSVLRASSRQDHRIAVNKGRKMMDFFVELDVSLRSCALCVFDSK